MIVTRFAPSPNGLLHAGHAYAAIVAHDLANRNEGRFLLRIEDIDGARSKPELAQSARDDLAWLGLEWEEVAPQSTRLARYTEAVARLEAEGLLYRCTCTRREIAAAATRQGPDGPLYPGTCRGRTIAAQTPHVLRLDVAKAVARTGPLHWHDDLAGPQTAAPALLGDVVLVRRSEPASYHLAVTLDDAADGVTHVVRGRDLFAATHIHRTLQALLDLSVPCWHHHPLLLDVDGRKLAKRDGSPPLADLRENGVDGAQFAADLRAGRWPQDISLESHSKRLPRTSR
ncbi:MAG: tRNA glutamyl-Q(34) synthetase GluQRS [Parerythrobacter sp.]